MSTQQLNLQRVISVKGKPGLFLLKSHNSKGFHLSPIEGGPPIFIANAHNKVLALGNIGLLKIEDGSLSLEAIFNTMINSYPPNNPNEVEAYFKQHFPSISPTVKLSHMVKITKWFQLCSRVFGKVAYSNLVENDGLSIV